MTDLKTLETLLARVEKAEGASYELLGRPDPIDGERFGKLVVQMTGKVVAVFETPQASMRYVVEHKAEGGYFYHIYAGHQLRPLEQGEG